VRARLTYLAMLAAAIGLVWVQMHSELERQRRFDSALQAMLLVEMGRLGEVKCPQQPCSPCHAGAR